MIKNVLAVVSVCVACACSLASAAELSKEDAKKLFMVMGYKNVAIAGVVNGVGTVGMGAFGGPNVAVVFAYVEINGKPSEEPKTFFYDKDLGWFYYQIDTAGRRAQVWTTSGYKEFKPEATPDK